MPESLEPVSHPSPLFRDVPDEDARALAQRGRERRYRAGQYIVEQGAVGDALSTILGGSVRIVMTSPEGTEATLTLLSDGDSFGELSLFDDAPRVADAIALTTTRVMVVSRAAFSHWLAERPHLAEVLLRALSRRVRHTDRLLADFTFVHLPARLARRILDLCSAQGVGATDATRVKVTQPNWPRCSGSAVRA